MGAYQHGEGIVITGGTINADVLAVGRGAQAIKNVAASADDLEAGGHGEVATRLRELIEAVKAHADELDAPDKPARSTEMVAQELTSPQPNKLTVRAVLDNLLQATGSVTAVAKAVGALQLAVGALL